MNYRQHSFEAEVIYKVINMPLNYLKCVGMKPSVSTMKSLAAISCKAHTLNHLSIADRYLN